MTPLFPCVLSDIGRRETNQDRACAESTTVSGEPAVLLAVADGMGGMRSGDVAAQIAIDTVRQCAVDALPSVPATPKALGSVLVTLFQDANRRVWERAQRDGIAGNMGSTLVCCLIFGNRYLVANAGDSRCYYINDHEVRQVTTDHSQVEDMVRRGVMTEESALLSPFRHQLTNSLGEPHDIPVDVFPAKDAFGVLDEPCVLLLSSDGLHGHVTDADLLQQVRSTASVPEACASLLNLALARGSTDNITAVAVEIGELSSRSVSLPAEGLSSIKGPATVKLTASMIASRRRSSLVPATVATVLVLIGGSLCFPQARDLAARQLLRPARAWFQGMRTPVGNQPPEAFASAPRESPGYEPLASSPPRLPPAALTSSPAVTTGTPPGLNVPASANAAAPDRSASPWNAGLSYDCDGDTIVFKWTPLPGAKRRVSYLLEVSSEESFGSKTLRVHEFVNTPEFSWTPSKPWARGRELYARVTAQLERDRAEPGQRSVVLTVTAPARK